MTVKEAVSVLECAKIVKIGWGGQAINLDISNALMMDAYGDYKVASLCGYCIEKNDEFATCYEIDIAVKPEKEPEHG